MAPKDNLYMSGHSKLVLDWHSARTAASSAAYLLNFLRPEMHIVIIGYDTGSTTADLAVQRYRHRSLGLMLNQRTLERLES
jgi:hypothetical protein